MADPMQLFNSPPSFASSAGASGAADNKGVSSFISGDFTVNGMSTKNMLILGGIGLAVWYFFFRK